MTVCLTYVGILRGGNVRHRYLCSGFSDGGVVSFWVLGFICGVFIMLV